MIETIESAYIYAANFDNFQNLVLDNSFKGPVLVNFWSKNAGPCLRQYPILDVLIHKYDGRLLLVNIDTELEFKITKEYSIASVPTLKLFRDGNIVETMHGYQSETDLNRTLLQYIAKDSDQALAGAIEQYAKGDSEQAIKMITDAIVDDPENSNLPVALCKILKHEQRYVDALSLLGSLPENMLAIKDIAALQDELGFLMIADKITDIKELIKNSGNKKTDIKAMQQLSAFYILNKEYELALKLLVKMMDIDKKYDDAYPRLAMLKIFNIIGQGHDLVTQFRPSLRCYTH